MPAPSSWTGAASPSASRTSTPPRSAGSGSTATGIKAAATAAPTLTATALELGGKNAFVVFADADLDKALLDAVDGSFFNKGEACTAASRIFVHESIYPQFVARMTAAVRKLRVGNGLDETVHVGPVVSRVRRDQVLADEHEGLVRDLTDYDRAFGLDTGAGGWL